jgi:hypothetical protein
MGDGYGTEAVSAVVSWAQHRVPGRQLIARIRAAVVVSVYVLTRASHSCVKGAENGVTCDTRSFRRQTAHRTRRGPRPM